MENEVIIVSGLPRSGTSMLMKILENCGFTILTDKIRKSDIDNPLGYYEFEKVKSLDKDNTWLNLAQGKVVKIVSPLLKYLPNDMKFKVIFIERNLNEIMSSQNKMLRNRKEESIVSDEELTKIFKNHINKTKELLSSKKNIEVIYINYNKILRGEESEYNKVKFFLNKNIDIEKMKEAVEQRLHRNRN
ncbi:MAG: sulfotransferase domain-containing protein [Candidatus Thorarchaeota archaeon]